MVGLPRGAVNHVASRRIQLLALVAPALVGAAASAQPLRLSLDAQASLAQFEAGTVKLAQAREAAAALSAGERPARPARDWEGLAEAFQGAARSAQRADGPLFPEPPAPVPPEQLKGCASRAAAVARADRALKGLQALAQRCADTRVQLRERIAAAQEAEEGFRALLKTLAGLPDTSGVAALFPGRWAGQQAPVAAALASFREALARQAVSAERHQADLRARAGALSAALAEASRGKDCQLGGRWAGAASRAGTVSGVTLELSGDGASWGGSANLGGVRLQVRGVSLDGASVQISLAEGQALSGTLATDGRTFSGTWSSPEGPAAFSLQRQ